MEIRGTTAAEIIRAILKAEGIKQKDLALIMGVTKQRANQMLNDKLSGMRFETLRKTCETLGYEIIVKKSA